MDEKNGITRRSALALMTGAVGAIITPGSVFGAIASPDDFIGGKGSTIAPFPMTQVRLLDGIFKAQAEINQTYLDSLATDRLLHSFRVTSGIASTATPYGGWERPDCDSARPLQWRALPLCGRAGLRERGQRDAAQERRHDGGRAGALPEGEWQRLSERLPGEQFRIAGRGRDGVSQGAGRRSTPITRSWPGCWICMCTPATSRRWPSPKAWRVGCASTSRTSATISAMRMLRTEYGGMNEVLANLYGLTGKQQYLGYGASVRAAGLSGSAGRPPRRVEGAAREYACAQGDRRGAHV